MKKIERKNKILVILIEKNNRKYYMNILIAKCNETISFKVALNYISNRKLKYEMRIRKRHS